MHPGDPQRRVQFCHWLRGQLQADNNFANKILWTDECRFTNQGMFNRHNEHYWANVNPNITRPVRNQHQFSVNVWAGILGRQLIGPYIYEGNLNGMRYLHFLRNEFLEHLDEIPLAQVRSFWFHQDGAPAHNTRDVRDFLNDQFPGQWIGNGGVVEWPARSPDLTPMDFFLWGTVKGTVYKNHPTDIRELRQNISNAFRILSPAVLQKSVDCVRKRINLCIQVDGEIFEHLL